MPLVFHQVAFLLFGLTGGLAAVKRGYDFIGLFALAFATAAGGGLIRDGLFIQDGPPLITQDSRYITVIALSAMMSVLFRRNIMRLGKLIAWLDAFGLSVYAIVGLQMALAAGLSIAASVIVGVISASGGGLLRDLIAHDEPLMLKPGQFYVLAALLGCGVFVLASIFEPTRLMAAYLGVGASFVTRILAIQFNWTTRAVANWNTLFLKNREAS
jgi:uncharacterized membrane protein YeiH